MFARKCYRKDTIVFQFDIKCSADKVFAMRQKVGVDTGSEFVICPSSRPVCSQRSLFYLSFEFRPGIVSIENVSGSV